MAADIAAERPCVRFCWSCMRPRRAISLFCSKHICKSNTYVLLCFSKRNWWLGTNWIQWWK